jgi:KDO2-lipid IV(A) lauroyltransferase
LLSDALGRPLRGVVRRNNSACLEAEFERARQRVFGPTLAKKDVRGLLRALQHGEIIAYSADQDFSYGHAFVPFFGEPAATLTGTAELARRANARVLPFWFHRDEAGLYRLRVEAEWPQWHNATPEQSAAIYMRELEAVVREKPEQYLWVHRRFKTRPPGAAPVY